MFHNISVEHVGLDMELCPVLKWSARDEGAQLMTGDQWAGGHEGKRGWGWGILMWGIFYFYLFKWCILVYF